MGSVRSENVKSVNRWRLAVDISVGEAGIPTVNPPIP